MVNEVLSNDNCELTRECLCFKNHYGLITAFCNLGKGNVETKVGYYRRSMLVPVPRVDGLEAHNVHLLKQCDEDILRPHYLSQRLHKELFEDDRKSLLPLPSVVLANQSSKRYAQTATRSSL